MSLPVDPTQSLINLPSALRAIFASARIEKILYSDPQERVVLYRLSPSLIVRVEEHLQPNGSVCVTPMNPASILVRPVNDAVFAENVPIAELIFPGLFVLDFKKLPELFPTFQESRNLVAAFHLFLQGLNTFGLNQKELSIISVEADHCFAIPLLQRLTEQQRQWNLGDGEAGVHLAGAHHTTKGCKSVVVAILDNGIRRDHVEFAAPLADGRLLMPVGGNVLEPHLSADVQTGDHGTACASIVFAQQTTFLMGIAPDCSLLPVKVTEGACCFASNIISGITFARRQGARIISLSQEASGANEELKNAIRQCADILFVVSAGNDNHDLRREPIFPACYGLPNMISVIACTETAVKERHSNFSPGEEAHVAAPGEYVPHCDVINDHSYNLMTGTSIAAPHVAGIAALAWSIAPRANVEDVRRWILKSAVPKRILSRKCLTGARVDATGAVGKAIEFLHLNHLACL